jgi:hypothetical protein
MFAEETVEARGGPRRRDDQHLADDIEQPPIEQAPDGKGGTSKGEFFNRHIRDHFTFERDGEEPASGLS